MLNRFSKHIDWSTLGLLLIFLIGAPVVIILMSQRIESQGAAIRAGWVAQIESIGLSRAQQIDNWVEARRTEVEVLASAPSVRALLTGVESDREELLGYLDRMAAAYRYASIVIFNARGLQLASSRREEADIDSSVVALTGMRTGSPQIELSEGKTGRQIMTIAIPVLSEPGAATSPWLGVVALRVEPEFGLFRLLKAETLPRTDETLLFRLDPRAAEYLSPLKDKPAGPEPLARSLEALTRLAGRAVDGRASDDSTDYRNLPVLVAVHTLPSLGWGLAVKVDRDEVMAEVYRTARLIKAAGALLLMAFAGVLITIWRQRRRSGALSPQIDQEHAISNLRGYAEKNLVTMTGIPMSADEPDRLLLIVQDLSEEERLQAAQRASEDRFRDLVQGLDAIVWEVDAETLKFSFVSQRAEIMLGYPVGRWLDTPNFYISRIHPDDRVRAMRICREAIQKGEDHEYEYRALRSDGREVWLRDIVHVVPNATGGSAQLRGLTVDLTERKRAEEALQVTEEQLRQAQKMDAVGKLAGGIAHDFNNLLMVIRGEADLILRWLDSNSPLRQNAEGIREASDQAASLTRQLLAFSRKQVLAPAVVDLNTVVAGIQQMLRRLITETIHLETITTPDLGLVKADPGQLEQMILNLAVNARDAMPDGGRLTIATSNVEMEVTSAQQRGVAPGAYVVLEVSDTGVGIDSETQKHLFEPFFTTKDQGKGTGLGLSTVYGIVRQSGGHIRLDSEPGKGATFRVYLPRVEQSQQASARAGSGQREGAAVARDEVRNGERTEATRGRETVLLVEDAKRVRQVVREILEMNGYEVLEARHGAEALKLSARHQGPIHLMLTDVVMPEMSGRELAQRLMPLRPDMRVLYMSGYTDDAIVRHGVLDSGIAFIAKPFTPDGLAAKVRDVLDSPIGSPLPVAPALAKPQEQEEVGARLSGA